MCAERCEFRVDCRAVIYFSGRTQHGPKTEGKAQIQKMSVTPPQPPALKLAKNSSKGVVVKAEDKQTCTGGIFTGIMYMIIFSCVIPLLGKLSPDMVAFDWPQTDKSY